MLCQTLPRFRPFLLHVATQKKKNEKTVKERRLEKRKMPRRPLLCFAWKKTTTTKTTAKYERTTYKKRIWVIDSKKMKEESSAVSLVLGLIGWECRLYAFGGLP